VETATIAGTRLDYFIVIGYFAAIFTFGALFARFTKSTKDFFFGGQRFSWWLVAFSYVASIVGSYSFIKYSAAGFNYGLSSSMSYLNDWIVMSLLLFGWFPIIYFSRCASVPEYFQKRFDSKTRVVATIMIMVYMLGYIGINLYTMGVAINALLGYDVFWSAVVVAVICALYVAAGGQTSVIMTDLAQGVILLVAGLLLLGLGLHAVGGLDAFWSGLPAGHKLPFASFNEPHSFHFSGIFWQDGVANNIALYMMNQGFILRFLSLKSVKEGKKAFSVLLIVLMPLATLAIANAGWLGRSMVTLGILPADTSADRVFVDVAQQVCVPGLFGFVMAALTAALMSTVDTLINAVSAVTVNDIYKPYFKPKAADSHYLKVARIVSLSAAGFGIALVPLFASFKSIYTAHGAFTATVTPPMVVAIVLGAFWKRYTPKAAFWTITGGAAVVALSIAFPVLITPFGHGVDPGGGFKFMRALFGLAAALAIALAVTCFTRPKPYKEIEGLVIGSIRKGMERFKGGKLNETPGKPVTSRIEVVEEIEGVSLADGMLRRLCADEGDMIYLSDKRWWLGGLRSVHTKITGLHSDGDVIRVSSSLAKEGSLLPGRTHKVEKIF